MPAITRRGFIKLAASTLAALAAYRLLSPLINGVEEAGVEETGEFSVEVLGTGLEVPWSLSVLDDNSILVTERPGRVTRILDGGGRRTIAKIEVASVGEAGLLGLALHPDFPGDRRIYLYATQEAGGRLVNRVLQGKLDPEYTRIDGLRTLLDGIPGARIHDGGRIRFGPDSMLYITTGDAARPELAQDLNSLAGKILRITPDGEIPGDNPFYPSPVYSYGHRNPQGIDWHPTGRMYSSEHGPIGRDELNEIVPGGNYGWPYMAGKKGEKRPGLIEPVIDFGDESIAPSGASFATRGPQSLKGSMLIACLRARMLVKVDFDSEGNALNYSTLLENRYGRLRDVIPHPDGGIIIATSNRDGRGTPREGDDKIIRLT
ncbi:MAG: PQQ-dependent sugar dehydrogenase [Desulfurococcales archaeon]|nr:PQQ-dependent sugar dehydrogenase [Desulfurococcales archaeon]